jgi:hypothetical protein
MNRDSEFVSEYTARLTRELQVRRATLGEPGNRHIVRQKRRPTTYGPTRGTIGENGCSVHARADLRVLTSGRIICRICETQYALARRRALGVLPRKKRGRNGRTVCTHEGACDYRTSGGKRYCRTRRTEWQRAYREARRSQAYQDKVASLLAQD